MPFVCQAPYTFPLWKIWKIQTRIRKKTAVAYNTTVTILIYFFSVIRLYIYSSLL